MSRVLVIGEAPGRSDSGLTRKRLTDLSGRPWEEWADFINLVDQPQEPGRSKGHGFDTRAARVRAYRLVNDHELAKYEWVVLLGRRVAQAVLPGGAGFPFFRWTEHGGTNMVVIPHTSGIVRNWNDPDVVARARALLSGLAFPEGLPDGVVPTRYVYDVTLDGGTFPRNLRILATDEEEARRAGVNLYAKRWEAVSAVENTGITEAEFVEAGGAIR